MERQKVNLRGDYSKYSVLNELSFRGLFFPLASTIVNGGSRNFDLGTYGYSNGVKGDDCSFFFYNKSTSDSATINVYCTNQSNVNIYKFEPLYMSDDVTVNGLFSFSSFCSFGGSTSNPSVTIVLPPSSYIAMGCHCLTGDYNILQ